MPYDSFAALQEQENRRVRGEYATLRNELQQSYHSRGIARSGFMLEDIANLDAGEAAAQGQVQVGNTDRLLQYRQQQEQLRQQNAMLEAQRQANKGNKNRKWLGAALGLVGVAAAPFTGGATLPLAATGASMYMAEA